MYLWDIPNIYIKLGEVCLHFPRTNAILNQCLPCEEEKLIFLNKVSPSRGLRSRPWVVVQYLYKSLPFLVKGRWVLRSKTRRGCKGEQSPTRWRGMPPGVALQLPTRGPFFISLPCGAALREMLGWYRSRTAAEFFYVPIKISTM